MKYFGFLQVDNENMMKANSWNISDFFKLTMKIWKLLDDVVFIYLPLLLNQFNDSTGADFTAGEARQA